MLSNTNAKNRFINESYTRYDGIKLTLGAAGYDGLAKTSDINAMFDKIEQLYNSRFLSDVDPRVFEYAHQAVEGFRAKDDLAGEINDRKAYNIIMQGILCARKSRRRCSNRRRRRSKSKSRSRSRSSCSSPRRR